MSSRKERALADDSALLEDTVQQLQRCKYFETMTAEVLRLVLRTGKVLEVPADTALIREGGLDDDLYFLLEGSLQVLSKGKLILRLNTPGDIVGEFVVVSAPPRSADVITEVPSRVVQVSSSIVKDSATDPKLAVEFYHVFSHIMAAKLRETSRRARLYEDAVLEAQEIATAHTRLESEIQDKLQEVLLYSKVLESSNDAVLITDNEGRVVSHNPAADTLLHGLGVEGPLEGHDFTALMAAFDYGLYDVASRGQPWRGEWTSRDAEEPVTLLVTVTPIAGSDQRPVGTAFQLRDISQQKAQERAIAAKNEEIKNALLDLEATYQELQRSDRLKTETLNVISQELNAPIRKILNHSGKVSQALDQLEPEQITAHIGAIHEHSEHLRIISENINYLLDLQVDFQQNALLPIDMRELLRRVSAELNTWASRKSVRFKLELPPEALTLTADREQLGTVFNLLLEQALLVAKNKSELRVHAEYAGGEEQVEVRIDYRGPSLKQVDPHQGTRKGRMGLLIGLPLARKVISQYQGSLKIDGNAKHGNIAVRLPRVQKTGEERPNRILIMDESDMDRMIAKGVIDHLWPDSLILSTKDPFELLDNYEDFRPDLVILDPAISEPGWSNHRVLAALTQHRRHVCPILSISALYRDFAERTIAVERGVTDFLAKPYSIFDLRFKVKSLLQSHRKEESLHQTMDQAQRQAYTDALTQLPNRKHLDEFLETQVEYSRQTRKPCSVVMLDVDNFKHYNDTNGHQLGDQVLQQIGRILSESVRSSDLAARYGGEEFSVVLPETGKEMAAVVAEKVRRTVQEAEFPFGASQPLGFVSASFGVSTFDEDGSTAEGLIQSADQALYEAKDRGRNRVVTAGRDAAPEHTAPPRAKAGA